MICALLVSTIGAWMRVLFNTSLAVALIGGGVAALSNPLYINSPSFMAATWFSNRSVSCLCLH